MDNKEKKEKQKRNENDNMDIFRDEDTVGNEVFVETPDDVEPVDPMEV